MALFLLEKAGQAIDYGTFLTAVINFFIIALVLFFILKAFNAAEKKSREELEKISSKTVGKIKKKNDKKGDSKEEEKEPETKLCPYCLSEIPYKATRCSHCTSILDEEDKADKK